MVYGKIKLSLLFYIEFYQHFLVVKPSLSSHKYIKIKISRTGRAIRVLGIQMHGKLFICIHVSTYIVYVVI